MISLEQYKTFLKPYTGATESKSGEKGLVPAPKKDETKGFYLSSIGIWSQIDYTELLNTPNVYLKTEVDSLISSAKSDVTNNILNGNNTYTGNNTYSGKNNFTSDNTFSGKNNFTSDNTFGGNNTYTGNNTYSGDNTYTGNNTFSGENVFENGMEGTAMSAYWADLAEYYETDYQYPKGTLVKFGGKKEITIADDEVNAVITSKPGFILNSKQENGQAIALVGRVPVRVIGKVNKFDYLHLSSIPGVAESVKNSEDEYPSSNVIARALEDKDTEEEGLVLCVVKFEL